MKINKLIFGLTAFILLALTSCEDMDEINKNPNDPTEVNSNLIITDVIVSTAFRVASGDYNYYASVYSEHNAGIYNQFYNAEIRKTEPQVAATYNNTWEAIYSNMYAAKDIIEKCSTGSEAGNYHTLGIARVLTAINLATLTDAVGDAPWSQALQPGTVYNPELDSQEDIYKAVFALLDSAVVNLGKDSKFPSLGSQDPIFGGSATAWKKTAHALIARYKLRLHFVQPDLAGVISNANASFADASEQCALDYETIGGRSPFVAMFEDRDYYGASQSMFDKLVAASDPRKDVLWKVHPEADDQATIVYAKAGDPDLVGQVQGLFSISAITAETAPSFLASYHELQFILAEAYARNGELAKADSTLKNGVLAAFDKIAYVFAEGDDVAAIANTYYTDEVKGRFDADPLKEIMLQKYIALYEEEAFQGYCDIRRLKALGQGDYIALSHPQPALFPLRYTYGSSDVTTNLNVESAYQDVDVFTDNVWWAGGNK